MPMFPNAYKGGGPSLHTSSDLSVGSRLAAASATSLNSAGSAAWPTANLAILTPLWLPEPVTVAQIGWSNGSAVSGNVDAAIYNIDGVRLISTGSTAQTGTNTFQLVNITDTQIGPGLVYISLCLDNITGTIERMATGSVLYPPLFGIVQVAANFPQAATVIFATAVNDFIPHVALLKQAVA